MLAGRRRILTGNAVMVTTLFSKLKLDIPGMVFDYTEIKGLAEEAF